MKRPIDRLYIWALIIAVMFTSQPCRFVVPSLYAAGPSFAGGADERDLLRRKIKQHTEQAQFHFDNEEYNLAIYEWHIALSLDPGNGEIEARIQDAEKKLADQRKKIGAVRMTEAGFGGEPEQPPERDAAGELSGDSDRMDEARNKFLELEEAKRRDELERGIAMGKAYYNSEDYRSAIQEWKIALSIDPGNERIRRYIRNAENRLARQLMEVKKEVRGMESQRAKDRSEAHLRRAKAFYESQDYLSAIDEWKLALAVDPSNRNIQKYIKSTEQKIIRFMQKEEDRYARDVQLALQNKIDRYVGLAKVLIEQDDYESALEEYKKALSLDPKNRQLNRYIAETEENLARSVYQKTEEKKDDARQTLAERIEGHLELARSNSDRQDFKAAIEEYKKALSYDPGNRRIQEYIENTEKQLFQHVHRQEDEEKEQVRQAIRDTVSKHLKVAKTFIDQQDFRGAIEEYKKALALEPDSRKIKRRIEATEKMLAKHIQRQEEDAEARARRALQEKIDRHIELAKALAELHDHKSAIEEYKKALSLKPGDTEIKKYIDDAGNDLVRYIDQKEKEAEDRLRQALQGRIEEHIKSAHEFAEQRDFKAAIEEFKTALSYDPKSKQIKRYIADAEKRFDLYISEKDEEAKERVRQALKNKINSYFERAREHSERRDYKAAINEYQNILFLDPDNKQVKRLIAGAEKEYAQLTRDEERSAEETPRAVAQAEIDGYVREAKAHQKKRDYGRAIEEYKRALALDPESKELEEYIHNARIKHSRMKEEVVTKTTEKERQTSPEKIDILLKEARIASGNKDYRSAIKLWNYALTLDPGNRRIAKYITRANRKPGLSAEDVRPKPRTKEERKVEDENVAVFAKARDRGEEENVLPVAPKEETAGEIFLRAERHFNDEEYESAIDEWNRALAIDPKNEKIRSRLQRAGDVLLGRIKDETARLERKKSRKEIDVCIEYGKEDYWRGDYAAAVEKWKRALGLDPKNKQARGLIRLAEGQVSRSEKLGSQREAAAYLKYGKEDYERGDRGLAVEKWKKALELDPENREARHLVEGIEFRKKLAGNQGSQREIDACFIYGKEDYARGDYSAAIEKWERVLEIDPDNKQARHLIQAAQAAIIGDKVDKDEPVEVTGVEKKYFQDQFSEHMRQGKRLFIRKEYDTALEEWNRALALRPDSISAKRLIEKVTRRIMKKREEDRGEVQIRFTDHVPEKAQVLSLKECVDIAVKNNIALAVANKSLKLAKMRVWEARRGLLGKISARYEDYEGRVTGESYDGRRYLFDIEQPIYRGGELYFTMRQAEVNLEVVRNDYARVKNELVLKIKKAYYTLGKSRESFHLQKELLDEVAQIADRVDVMYEEGLCSKGEFLNVKSQRAQVEFQVISAKQDILTTRLILLQGMSLDLDINISVKPELKMRPIKEISLDKCTQLAITNRQEIRIHNLII